MERNTKNNEETDEKKETKAKLRTPPSLKAPRNHDWQTHGVFF